MTVLSYTVTSDVVTQTLLLSQARLPILCPHSKVGADHTQLNHTAKTKHTYTNTNSPDALCILLLRDNTIDNETLKHSSWSLYQPHFIELLLIDIVQIHSFCSTLLPRFSLNPEQSKIVHIIIINNNYYYYYYSFSRQKGVHKAVYRQNN